MNLASEAMHLGWKVTDWFNGLGWWGVGFAIAMVAGPWLYLGYLIGERNR